MDGADARLFELLQRFVEMCAGGVSEINLVVAGGLDLLAQPKLQFAGGLFSESHRDHTVEGGAAGGDNRDDTADQRRGLAGAGGGLDDERGVEVGADVFAHTRIGGCRRGGRDSGCGSSRTRVALCRVIPVMRAYS